MPYPLQVDYDALIERASEIIEKDGLEGPFINKVAEAFGVKAASLYKHVANKAALLQAVNLRTAERLVAAVQTAIEATQSDDPKQQVLAMMHGYRAFVHQNPATYNLAYTSDSPELRPDPKLLESLALPLQAKMAQLSGQANALAALRGAMALIHGYALLELNRQFQRGGDLDETFDQVIHAYLDGWAMQDGS